jgi:polysaccharide deacetylase 2 family uncharacterized protein YibQ
MAKKKSRKSGPHMLVLLVGMIIAVYVLIRFLDSDRGRIFLLDIGFDSRYAEVQQDLGDRVIGALHIEGIADEGIRIERRRGAAESHDLVMFRAAIPEGTSFIAINSAIDDAVRSGGGRVRTCREERGGRSITMEIGTRRHVTHRCLISKDRRFPPPDRNRGRSAVIALVIDDFGYFYNRLVRDFLALDIDFAISVIPGLRYSEKVCREAQAAGKEILCHLPMEPEEGAEDYGEIPLVRVEMGSDEINKIVREALKTTPGVVGMNNHMGSKATSDRRVVKAVLDVCRDAGLFFIDSMTSPRSVVGDVAREEGMPCLSNDMFVDNSDEETRANMEKLLAVAARRGRVLAIMHVRKDSLEDLRWFIGRAKREGVRFVRVSTIIKEITVARTEGGSP